MRQQSADPIPNASPFTANARFVLIVGGGTKLPALKAALGHCGFVAVHALDEEEAAEMMQSFSFCAVLLGLDYLSDDETATMARMGSSTTLFPLVPVVGFSEHSGGAQQQERWSTAGLAATVRTDDPMGIARLVAALPSQPKPTDTGPVVLIVDDSAFLRSAISEAVKRRGYTCRFADDGTAALEAVQRDEFAAIIMDVEMPVMGGLEATRRIRAMGGWLARVPIIGCSAHLDPHIGDEGINAGMTDFVRKDSGCGALLLALTVAVPATTPAAAPPTVRVIEAT